MAVRRDFAIGTDDVGTVTATDIEASTLLHLFAAVPPPAPVVAEIVLLDLEPAQALALCESSPFYQEICDSDGFKERYNKMWHTAVHLVDQARNRKVYSLFRTRTVGDVKGLYEREFGVARTEYTLMHLPAGPGSVARYMARDVVPTAQSILGGMTKIPHEVVVDSWLLMFNAFAREPRSDDILTHWFANGETIELSE